MDKSADDFNKASHVLLDAEVNLNSITIRISSLEKDIAFLTQVEANIRENIRFMKRKKIAVVASEFRKAKLDLQACRSKVSLLRMDRENSLKIQGNAEYVYNKAKDAYYQAYQRLHYPMNNVLYPAFGRKNGQE